MILDSLAVTSVSAAAIVPIIIAVTQAIKMVFPTDRINKWAPLISITLGLLASFIFNRDHDMSTGDMIMTGIIYGLSSSGLYSGVKSTAHATKGSSNDGNPSI